MHSNQWKAGYNQVRQTINSFESRHGVLITIKEEAGKVITSNQVAGKRIEFESDEIEECGTADDSALASLSKVVERLERLLE